MHKFIFSKTSLSKFIYWLGYVASGQCASELKMAKALEPYCEAGFPTIRRWINSEAKPNGTNMLIIYGGILAAHYEGHQEKLIYDFIKFSYPEYLDELFKND